jgi:molybdopterin-guanine dinucleotide biosynthesis protein A
MVDIPLMGVVLAGGKSSRMGTDKANLPHPHQPNPNRIITYLQHAVMRLGPLVPTIAISGRSEDMKSVANVISIPDDSPHLGPAAGVAQSLRYAERLGLAGILVTPVDMPHLETDHLRCLIDAWQQEKIVPPCPVVVAMFANQQPEPLLAIYPTTLRWAVESMAQSNDRSLSRWLRQQTMVMVTLPQSAAKNVNRPEDL